MLDLFAPSIQQLQSLGIRYTIRENRIAKVNERSSDSRSDNVAKAKKDPEAMRARHAEWKALFAIGKTPQEIADQSGVDPTTVRRVTGGRYKRTRRKCCSIQVGKKTYLSQIEAMRDLHISRVKLLDWIDKGKAKYVR